MLWKAILWTISGYIIGSIPWGLVIGKVFYHVDIRDYGSGNPGGTNAGRVFGTPVGLLVIFLDGSKALLMMYLCHLYVPGIEKYVGLAVCFGHCFPLFAGFRGGKAVACSYGYLLGLAVFVTHNYLLSFFLAFFVFCLVLALSHYVSLSSMCGVMTGAIGNLLIDRTVGILVLFLALFVIFRHRANIKRIINKTESKFYFKKK